MEETRISGKAAGLSLKVAQVYCSREERTASGRRFFSLTLEPSDDIVITSTTRLQALLDTLSQAWFEGEEALAVLPDELCEDIVDELPYVSEGMLEEPVEIPERKAEEDFIDVEFFV